MYKFVPDADADSKSDVPRHPRTDANIFEILTFSWMINLFKTGRKRDLNENDLYPTLNEHTSALLGDELEKKWIQELAIASELNQKPSLMRVLFQMIGYEYIFCGLLICFNEIFLRLSQPLIIGKILTYFNPESSKEISMEYAYIYALCLILNLLLSSVLNHITCNDDMKCGIKISAGCSSVIFRKALRLSCEEIGENTVSKVINIMSNDVNRFSMILCLLHYLWVGPLQTIVATYFVWQEIGVSSIIGVAVLILYFPLQGWLGKKMSRIRIKTSIRTDKRVRLISEIITGIKVIKMFTWEIPFTKQVEHARKKEMQQIRGSLYIRAISSAFIIVQPRLQIFVSIVAYMLLGNFILIKKVYVITTFYNILAHTMANFFNRGIAQLADLVGSVKRIQSFLLCKDKDDQTTYLTQSIDISTKGIDNQIHTNGHFTVNNNENFKKISEKDNSTSLVISNASAKWTKDHIVNTLQNINLTVKRSQLIAIIGPVGAGKSSLLKAILQELPLINGSISVQGKISYASQEPWLFSGSVKQNIVFDSLMDQKRYKQVIEVCALKNDLKQFTHSDSTIVGARGATLSGGQKARINLARAVYKHADVYLLDDPLSAVDTCVGKHLFEKCIKEFLKEKTCILITHQIQFLNNADKIVLMDNANILAEGSYQELQDSGFDFATLFRSSEEKAVKPNMDGLEKNLKTEELCSIIIEKSSDKGSSTSVDELEPSQTLAEPNKITKIHSTGKISKRVYLSYVSTAGNICKIFTFTFMFLFTQILITSGDYWICFWINKEEYVFQNENGSINNNYIIIGDKLSSDIIINYLNNRHIYILIYVILIISMTISIFIQSSIIAAFFMAISLNLHRRIFNSVISAKMFFFNTNSSGNIFNRFSKDIGTADELLPIIILDSLQIYGLFFGVIFVVGLINIYLLIPTFVVIIIFYQLRALYLPTSRSIKRLEGITQSPVLEHLNTTMQGLTTIRAYNAELVLSKQFEKYLDKYTSACCMYISSTEAFGLWLDAVCCVYISIVVFSVLFIDNNIHGGNVGLVISQTIGLAGLIQWGIRQSAELENQMTAVERILEYTKCPQETAQQSTSSKILSKGWPKFGKLVFQHLNLRYSPNDQLVLKDVNIAIQPMEKVGVVGRTGAGKSSLIEALFRLAFNEGKIIIDDIEIHELGLKHLRSSLSIIPQEPFLYSGTLRNNLDPFDEYADHILWDALDEVKLKVLFNILPNGLNTEISESGSNLSVGQKQLVCLARTIIRNNKILVLDEATANVDPQTDVLIQNTIRNKFKSCTVLTIAHRLSTIMDSDKVLVMDAGFVAEYDHPYILLKNKVGLFHQMVHEMGRATADLLYNVAEENFKMKNELPIKFIDDNVDGV